MTIAINLTGTWLGTAVDSTGGAQFNWTLVQSGNSITGTINPAPGSTANGPITGTPSGSTFTFSFSVGFSGPAAGCRGDGERNGAGYEHHADRQLHRDQYLHGAVFKR